MKILMVYQYLMWNEKIADLQNLKHLKGFSSTILPTLINTLSIKLT